MTNEEAIHNLYALKLRTKILSDKKALDMAIKALEIELLTDTEQRIFLKAINREREVCQKCNTILDELKDEIKRAFDDLTESEEYGEDDSYTEYNRGCVWGLLHSYEMFGREYEEVNADDE